MEPEDEWPHQPGEDRTWAEWWCFDFAATEGAGDAPLAGAVRLCLLPHQGTARYWASLVGDGRQPVVVSDDEVPLPRGSAMEIRTEGLWADHAIEAPFEQVGVGCEAFGLRLGSLDDLERNPIVGDRIPFGLDLEWATRSGAWVPEPPQGYRIGCEVYGEVLVGDERIGIDVPGSRTHAWGSEPSSFLPAIYGCGAR